MSWPTGKVAWLLCLVGLLAYCGLCALADAGGTWWQVGLSYAGLWPPIFVFTSLSGAAVGARLRTWQAGIIVTEIATTVATMVFFAPAFGNPRLFGQPLIVTHLALFPPLLLSVLTGGYYSKPR